jgi:hypothetical protein
VSNNEYHALTELVGEIDVLPADEVGRRSAELVLRTLERLEAGYEGRKAGSDSGGGRSDRYSPK